MSFYFIYVLLRPYQFQTVCFCSLNPFFFWITLKSSYIPSCAESWKKSAKLTLWRRQIYLYWGLRPDGGPCKANSGCREAFSNTDNRILATMGFCWLLWYGWGGRPARFDATNWWIYCSESLTITFHGSWKEQGSWTKMLLRVILSEILYLSLFFFLWALVLFCCLFICVFNQTRRLCSAKSMQITLSVVSILSLSYKWAVSNWMDVLNIVPLTQMQQ